MAVVAVCLLGSVPVASAGARPRAHCLVGFDGFLLPAHPLDPYYYGAEGGSVGFQVSRRDSDVCALPDDTSVQYRTVNGSASAPGDFPAQDETVDIVDGVGTGLVPLTNDPDVEAVVEQFELSIYETEQGWLLGGTNPVPAYVIDLDGATRVAFRSATLTQSETRTSVRIPVFMAGPIAGNLTVGVAVSPGPTNPATEGTDYMPPSDTTLEFGPGDRAKSILFSISNDSLIESDETIQVSLQPGAGYELAAPSTLLLTIADNDNDSVPPTTRWHHPRQGLKYGYRDYRIREMHVFFNDAGNPASGVVAVEMALRKNNTNGTCAWWAKGRWNPGSCSSKRWIGMTFDFDLYLRRFSRPLGPSMGTKTKSYTAWCRGIDGAGNVETTFTRGRNLSTFEVKPR